MNPNIDPMALTGLELIQALMQGQAPPPTMAVTMGLKLEKVDDGYALFTAQPGDQHLNPMGGVHGGFAATALDSATGCAVHTTLKPGQSYGTVDLNVKMLKPVPRNKGALLAEARAIHRSGRLGVAEGTLKDSDGVLYAHATATCMVFDANAGKKE